MRRVSIYINIVTAICVVVAMFAPVSVAAADSRAVAEAMWQEGVECYNAKEYQRAVDALEKIVDLGYASADLYYNIGDAYFKAGQNNISGAGRPFASGELGKAIVNYYRALRLDPAMKDARYNLDLAIDHTNDTEAVPVALITRGWRAMRDVMSSNGWAILSVIGLVIMLFFTLLYLLSRRITVRKVAFFVAVIVALVFILSTSLALSQRAAYLSDIRAVVMCNDTTPVHASPDSASKIIRQPSQGVTVEVVRDHEGWFEIEFADGEKGWIRATSIERI